MMPGNWKVTKEWRLLVRYDMTQEFCNLMKDHRI